MWLINTDNLCLVGIQGDPKEEYAILSHTWGGDEMTFSAYQALNNTGSSGIPFAPEYAVASTGITISEGYRKIKDAAQLAKSQGLKWLWVDTCCIDKTSSAELSESINSMYRWYQKAKVCYAYLSDVQSATSNDPSEAASSFRNSRWFTRGWTLQELIAPRSVEFYARDWSFINTKQADDSSFCHILAQITGVNESVLAGETLLSDISVANKMRWAASRETTRPEDMAYCLLGIFDVNMPLLYGEGMRAFVRLQEEILKESDDQSLFLWDFPSDGEHAADTLFGLLAPSPSVFLQPDLDHIRPLPPSESQESIPATATSQGLRTRMLLFPVHPEADEYYAMLDCIGFRSHEPAVAWSPCLMLRRLWGDQYARITSTQGSIVLFPHDSFDERNGTVENIYVKQNPFYALPEVTVRSRNRGGDRLIPGYLGFKVVAAYPPERWDPVLSIIRAKEPQSGHALLVLRFSSDERSLITTVDVSVGLRRVRRRWELCYEKHACVGDSLQQVYRDIAKGEIGSETTAHDSKRLSFVRVDTIETVRRGRRFIQLEVSGAVELDSKLALNTKAFLPETESFFSEIRKVTQSCCFEPQWSFDCFPAMLNVVRTKPADLREPLRSSKTMDELQNVVIDVHRPYASLIQAVRARREREIITLITKDRKLLESRTKEMDDFRPIHWAAAYGYLDILKTLTRLGASQTSRTRSGYMAIHLAIMNNNINLVGYLLEDEASMRRKTVPDFLHSLTTEREESVLHLLATPVSTGLANQRICKIIDLIRQDFGDNGNYSFPHINWLGESPLHRAAATSNAHAMEYLLDILGQRNFIDRPDNSDRSMMFHAACGGEVQIITRLLSLGSSLDLSDDRGRSPLHAAVMANKPEAVSTLLACGANPNSVTHIAGLTPLHFACLYGFSECLGMLLEWANMNQWTTGDIRMQPLHIAVANSHLDCVSDLLAAGCERDSRCNSYLELMAPGYGGLHEANLVLVGGFVTPAQLATKLGFEGMASIWD
ncbi:het domain protein [Colletotrichum truncatum]|uniref:Het domain protein n=1 Tax=Colletotrichum truncatum TaxID=5467 RepID=A0ACC3YQ15_COLTU|nr:het domain protein [Colletotrichum truncatum]KAF6796717.1 het domain protein [Colletotrichum truncatum]